MDYAIVCALVYLFAVAFIYAPQCPKAECPDPEQPIDYFPEPTPEPEATPAPKVIPQVLQFLGWESVQTSPETLPQPALEVAEQPDLASLGIRELKKLASAAKVKNYGKLKKHELILALQN